MTHSKLTPSPWGIVLLLCAVTTAACSTPHAEATADGQASHAQPLATVQVARVLVLGDSISAGVGAATPELGYAALLMHNDDALYPGMRGQDLAHRYGAAVKYINIAHSGDTTGQVLHQQIPRLTAAPGTDVAALGPFPLRGHTLVLLTAGGNDVRQQLGPGADYTGATLRHALDNLRQIMAFFDDPERFPDGASLYFANIYDVTDGTGSAHNCLRGMVVPGLTTALSVWADAYTHLANEPHVHLQTTLIDVLRRFYGHGFHYDDPHNPYFDPDDASLWLSDRDCIHPNNRGHHEIRRAFWQALNTTPPGHL